MTGMMRWKPGLAETVVLAQPLHEAAMRGADDADMLLTTGMAK